MNNHFDIDPYGEENWNNVEDYSPWGNCECGSIGNVLNIKKTHWAYCEKCKTVWYIGSNLFSSWLYENETIWSENEKFLKGYRIIN